jgi:hypothetical protein
MSWRLRTGSKIEVWPHPKHDQEQVGLRWIAADKQIIYSVEKGRVASTR